MVSTFSAGSEIRRLFETLPQEEVRHMRRVGTLVGLMAKKLHDSGLYQTYSNEYKYFGEAAVYHDIGKVWVPKNLLTKSGKLTEKETVAIRKHPVYAEKIFDQMSKDSFTGISQHLIQLTFDSAVYHHEWWNGTGYPYEIGYGEIPLVARITSICDTYDAITSNRSYRKAHTHYYACCELEKNSGTQFDPALVRVFMNHETEFFIFFNKTISCL